MRKVNMKRKPTMTYVPISERSEPIEDQLTLKIRRLDVIERAELKDKAVQVSLEGEITGIRTVSYTYLAAVQVVDGWENLKNEDGKEIEFNRRDRRAMFDILPEDIQDELARVFGNGSYDANAEASLLKAIEDDAAEAAEDAATESVQDAAGDTTEDAAEAPAEPAEDKG